MTNDRYSPVPPPPLAPTIPTPVTAMPAYGHWQPAPPPQRRLPGWIVGVAIITAIAAVAAFVLVLMWPGGSSRHVAAGPLEFHGFAQIGELSFDEASRTTLTAVQGDQGYAAWEQGGDLQVIAFDITTGQSRWRSQVSGASRWGQLIATPDLLLVIAHEPNETTPRKLFARDPATGDARWEIDVRGEDRLFFNNQTLGWLDRQGEALRGLDLITGEERWAHRFEGSAQAVSLVTPAALAQPTDHHGRSLPLAADHRIILVAEDRTVRVIDGQHGGLISEVGHIAGPDDLLLAYQDRLFVATDQRNYRVESYELADLTEAPRVVYAATDPERYPDSLTACGADRICVLDTHLYSPDTVEVVAVNVAGGAQWRQPVPGGERMVPVGEWLVVAGRLDFEPAVLVLDGEGEERHSQRGVAVRLNDGNLVLVDSTSSGLDRDTRASGLATAVGEPVELGRLPEVELENCAWNSRYLACPGRDTVEIWRFANE